MNDLNTNIGSISGESQAESNNRKSMKGSERKSPTSVPIVRFVVHVKSERIPGCQLYAGLCSASVYLVITLTEYSGQEKQLTQTYSEWL